MASHSSFVRVKRPRAIVFDVACTVAKTSFIEKVLLQYVADHVKTFLADHWHLSDVQADVAAIREQAKKDATIDPETPQIPEDVPVAVADAASDGSDVRARQKQQIAAVSSYMHYCTEKRIDNEALKVLRFHMWFDGFKHGHLETPVYSDVAKQLEKWHNLNRESAAEAPGAAAAAEAPVKLYVLSNGWAEATKRFLAKTNHGDLNRLIEGHFDAATLGELNDPNTYLKLLAHIKEPAAGLLFLTKSPDAAIAALESGLSSILVLTHRRNIEKLQGEAKKLPRVRSFNDIQFVTDV